jgi:KipI family sensor histidine kinase inhibitor
VSHSPAPTDVPRIAPLGDAALLVTFADTISRAAAGAVRRASERIAAARVPAVTDVVPAYGSLAVYYDAERTSYAAVRDRAAAALSEPGEVGGEEGPEVVIPVRYDGADLAEVAERTRLSVAEVIERHSAVRYYTYVLGFVPGFAYLGDLDPALVLPRRAEPRRRVPAGSVAIAGAQTAVYPLDTPGGWHILGMTNTVMFDPRREPPAFLRPGDVVRFEPVLA